MSELNKHEREPYTRQIKEIEQGALAGDARSQTAYGKCLLFGWGVAQDDAKAYEWFEKASDQGDEIAKMYKGHCMLYGIGTTKDEYNGYGMLNDALDWNYPDEGESQPQSDQSDFSHDDLCQLFLDLGDAAEKSLGVGRKYRSSIYYFEMLDHWGEPIGAERRARFKKTLFGWKLKD